MLQIAIYIDAVIDIAGIERVMADVELEAGIGTKIDREPVNAERLLSDA